MDDYEQQRVGLVSVRLADKPFFDQAFARLAQPISDYTFANTFIWSTSLRLGWQVIAGHLCLFANGVGDLTMLMPPVPCGPGPAGDLSECVQTCFRIMDEYNDAHGYAGRSRIEYVSDELLEQLNAVPDLNLAATPQGADYVYDTSLMISLEGGGLKSKRKARSKFTREHPDHRALPLDDKHIHDCIALLDTWHVHGDATHFGEVNEDHIGSDILRQKDSQACRVALAHYRELGLKGMCLFAEDRLVGFTLGEALSPTQCSILIEKTLPGCDGAPQLIFSEFCRLAWADYPWTNAGDDWGIPSLRFTKSSYRPIRLLNKYTLTPASREAESYLNRLIVPLANPPHVLAGTSADITPIDGQVLLRPADPTDADTIAAIESGSFDEHDETFTRRQVRRLIANPRVLTSVALIDGNVVGWSAGFTRRHTRSLSGRVYAVAIAPQARRKGVGKMLVHSLINALHDVGAKRIYLEVRDDNTPAIELYRRLGFVDHRFLPNYYGQNRHGQRMRLEQTNGSTTTI